MKINDIFAGFFIHDASLLVGETSQNIIDFDDSYNQQEAEKLFFDYKNVCWRDWFWSLDYQLMNENFLKLIILLKLQPHLVSLLLTKDKLNSLTYLQYALFLKRNLKTSQTRLCVDGVSSSTPHTLVKNQQEKCFQNPARRTKLGNKIGN